MSLETLGYHYDPNIFKKVTGTQYSNTDYEYDRLMVSDNHRKDKKGIYREGGPWFMHKIHVTEEPSESTEAWWDPNPIYSGRFVAPTPSTPGPINRPDLAGYGPEVWNRMKPDKPIMSLSNAFYELKDVPGMLRNGFKVNNLKDIANFNLAVNFGWLPLLQDIRNFVESHKKLNKELIQLLRNNGRPVHRRLSADNSFAVDDADTLSVSSISAPGFAKPTLVSYAYGDGFVKTLKTSYKERIWASGKFRYWLPEMGSITKLQYKRKLIRRLYGLRPTPYVIYRALPWSWMIDWFTNVGDNISNLNANVADRLICEYAYVMRTIESAAHCLIQGTIHSGPGQTWKQISATTTVTRTQKERTAASPFGFQVDPGSLSPYQLSILASLTAQRVT